MLNIWNWRVKWPSLKGWFTISLCLSVYGHHNGAVFGHKNTKRNGVKKTKDQFSEKKTTKWTGFIRRWTGPIRPWIKPFCQQIKTVHEVLFFLLLFLKFFLLSEERVFPSESAKTTAFSQILCWFTELCLQFKRIFHNFCASGYTWSLWAGIHVCCAANQLSDLLWPKDEVKPPAYSRQPWVYCNRWI